MNEYKKMSNGPLNFYLKPEYIYLPLFIAGSNDITLLVKKGDYVYKGDAVARKRDETKLNIYSCISGTIEDIQEKLYHNKTIVKCLKIKNDFKEAYRYKRNENKNFNLTLDEFINNLKKYSIYENDKIIYKLFNKRYKNIVIDSKDDTYITASSALIKAHPDEILDLLDNMLKITGSEECIILLDENDNISKNALNNYIGTYDRIKIMHNYKENNDLKLNISTIYSTYEAIRYDIPFMQKIITISGNGIKNPCNILIKNGTNARDLIEYIGGFKRFNKKNMFLISGGALKGISMPTDDYILGLDTNGITVLRANFDLEEKPCIRCGKCISICPKGLNPLLILHSKNPQKLNINLCDDCGLCSYICPSNRNLKERIRKAKENERI